MEFVYGHHSVYHALAAGRRNLGGLKLYLIRGSEKEESRLIELARVQGVGVSFHEASFFAKKLGPQVTHHQGVLLETGPYPYVPLDSLLGEKVLLILDNIQDPHNLGALCRSAYLFGVGGVVLCENHAAQVGPGAGHSSVGAVEYLRIARVSSIANLLEILKKNNYWVYGADHEGSTDLSQENFAAQVALVIGNEETGLRRLVKERCDFLIRIPSQSCQIDSFNASVSAGILLYEVFRQKSQKNE